MNKLIFSFIVFAVVPVFSGCDAQTKPSQKLPVKTATGQSAVSQTKSYTEGKDYIIYERVRVLDKQGFTEPHEAFSLLLPKGWTTRSEIIWTGPGSACAGTNKQLFAKSPDGKYSFEMFPYILYTWAPDAAQQQFQQNNNSPYCAQQQPMDAEQYLKTVFAKEIGNPEIIKMEPNQEVVNEMRQAIEKSMTELRQYGAGQMQMWPKAINAIVRWPDGTEGQVLLGVNITELVIPNNYTGSYIKSYTTIVATRILFKYPQSESEQAKNQFSVLMASIRTNPRWNDAVNKFWKDVRQQSHIAHVGRIKMIDERTKQIGDQAIQQGNERARNMDLQMRNWEQQQSSQDRMHTSFIKTIREVENFKDETGTYEMSSSYNNAWSRGDGNTFIMSNNPNFDPGFVFKDQSWKAMKKVQ